VTASTGSDDTFQVQRLKSRALSRASRTLCDCNATFANMIIVDWAGIRRPQQPTCVDLNTMCTAERIPNRLKMPSDLGLDRGRRRPVVESYAAS
jgi:hypothetical protein